MTATADNRHYAVPLRYTQTPSGLRIVSNVGGNSKTAKTINASKLSLKENKKMNAKQELVEHIKENKVLCISLRKGKDYDDDKQDYFLPSGFSDAEYQTFLTAIDFEYDDGHGGQELFGHIWYVDGTWSSRGEYDGSEWWTYNKCPEIPVKEGAKK